MNTDITLFNFEGNNIRTVVVDGEPWFVGKDVAEVLGYSNYRDAILKHCKGVAKRYPLQTAGGMQETRIINEPDMLRLIVKSQLPSAIKFEAWVFEEVLPQIRKTGKYSIKPQFQLPDFTNPAESARAWAEQFEKREIAEEKVVLLEEKIRDDKPKLLLAETLLSLEDGDGLIKPKDFAKAIESIYGVGRNTFYQILRDIKVWNKDNIPYARFVQAKYFSVKNGTFYNKYTRQEEATVVAFITPKGRQYLIGKLTSLFDVEDI